MNVERKRYRALARCFSLLVAFLLTSLLSTGLAVAAAPAHITLFVHVNVVPMSSDQVIRDHSVLIEDARIKAIGRDIPAPENARVIDGHGTEFLSPGLADMHTHSDTSRDMIVFLANGVTTVLNMGEARNSFMAQTRPKINRGETPGPHIYAAFLVDGTPEYGHLAVATQAEARALVDIAKTNDYDFIKVYNNLSPECFRALIEQGRVDGLPIVGHGVSRVGIERQLDEGQLMVAHAEEYLYTVFFPPDHSGQDAPKPEQIASAIDFTKRTGAFVTADLNTYATIARQWGKPEIVDDFLRQLEVRYLDPDDRIAWKNSPYVRKSGDLNARLDFLKKFTKALADAGVPLITGTDSPSIPGLVPGFSLHQDLHALEAAGLSRYQILRAATRNAGDLAAKAKPNDPKFGVIETGNRADLVLSEKNPLDDLMTLKKPLGVMANGRWYDRGELETLLEGVAAKYEAAAQNPSSRRAQAMEDSRNGNQKR
jgi:imidazolonepropionase-like amidohydrolase